MKELLKRFNVLAIFSIGFILLAVAISLFVYRAAFSEGLSSKPDNWSAFGSYIGGVFGPLISFVTLIAILKTISLQKELLDTQRQEFSQMQDLQDQTFKAQQAQHAEASRESKARALERTRDHLLSMVDRYLASYNSRLAITENRFDKLCQWGLDGKSVTPEHIDAVLKKKNGISQVVAHFHGIMADLSIMEFSTNEEMRAHFMKEVGEAVSLED
jgi:hypothetical protein